MATDTIQVVWREDGSATVLGRLTARDGTGNWTTVSGEGNFLKQADLSTITCKVFDLTGTTPTTAVSEPTVTISDSVIDTPVTDGKIWTLDSIGYNFRHDLASTVFTTAGNRYRVEYKFSTTGSTVGWGVYEGVAEGVWTS